MHYQTQPTHQSLEKLPKIESMLTRNLKNYKNMFLTPSTVCSPHNNPDSSKLTEDQTQDRPTILKTQHDEIASALDRTLEHPDLSEHLDHYSRFRGSILSMHTHGNAEGSVHNLAQSSINYKKDLAELFVGQENSRKGGGCINHCRMCAVF